jgi:uncharacterized protein YdeI (YjbR/CyaY-like superfamily)
MQKIESVDQYIQSHPRWSEILLELRELLNSTVLTETIKWGGPVYTLDGKNLLGIGAFKNHSALWFFQGALLQDNTNLLINAQEGKTKALRQIRFDLGSKIDKQELLKYIDETISLHKQGKVIKPDLWKGIFIPSELSDFFESNSELKKAFSVLTPGKQREYAEYITEAKREVTKQKRIEKIVPMIKVGIGLNDKYKNC